MICLACVCCGVCGLLIGISVLGRVAMQDFSDTVQDLVYGAALFGGAGGGGGICVVGAHRLR